MMEVLVVDDEVGMRKALEANFLHQGWRVRTASGKNEALAMFRSAPCPLVVTDMRMPDGDGLSVMQGVRALAPETAVILLTAFGTVPDAVSAMKEGAVDYLIKPVSFEQLKDLADRVLAGQAEANLETVEAAGPASDRFVGSSPQFRSMLARARQAAQTDADILVEAESGTGKEVLARFIHSSSPRRHGPFVAVNCAAFPDTLLESELFGHVRGAFTGAIGSKPGKFEQANGGTLLLDEIGEMPLTMQPKLLRVLQEREVDRLGDTHPIPIDVRVIATTNRSLRELLDEGKFRLDLYYRLNVIPMGIPPLRERRQDIPELAESFMRRYAARSARGTVSLSPELVEKMQQYNWPGNIRELENFIRRALALSTAPVIGPEVMEGMEISEPASSTQPALAAGTTLQEAERQLLARTLVATGGNRTRAAEMLGVSIRTVRNKIREYGLPPKEQTAIGIGRS